MARVYATLQMKNDSNPWTWYLEWKSGHTSSYTVITREMETESWNASHISSTHMPVVMFGDASLFVFLDLSFILWKHLLHYPHVISMPFQALADTKYFLILYLILWCMPKAWKDKVSLFLGLDSTDERFLASISIHYSFHAMPFIFQAVRPIVKSLLIDKERVFLLYLPLFSLLSSSLFFSNIRSFSINIRSLMDESPDESHMESQRKRLKEA